MKKRALFLFLVIAFISTRCTNATKDKTQETDSLQINENIDTLVEKSNEKEAKLETIIAYNNLALNQLGSLKKSLENKDLIKSVKDIEKILHMRDSLISLLNADDKFTIYMEEGDRLYEEFEALGIHIIEAEGLYFGLNNAPLLDDLIEKVADEPYILRNKITNLYSLASGSEYPYYDISEEMEIVPLAEKLLTKYPGHKYNKRILEILESALYPLVDVHQVETENALYIVGGYDVNAYPAATELSFHKEFIESAKNTRYTKVVKNILNSMSLLKSREFDKIYLVEVPDLKQNDSVFSDPKLNEQLKKLPEEIKEKDSWFQYLWLGVDVAHTLNFWDGDDRLVFHTYRFYDKKEPAEKSLQVIQKIIPSAKLIEYELTEKDRKYKN